MTVETLIGLDVVDDESYQRYRQEMLPILRNYGGGFRYDFTISKVLQSETDANINRVFIIHFPDEDAKKAFFSDPDYRNVREKHFDRAVNNSTIIATYRGQK